MTGPDRHEGPGRQPEVPILMYHEIAARPQTTSPLAVPPAAFAAQLAYLHYHGYNTVTFADAAAALAGEGGPLPTRPVVLTFDDGFADFHREVLPLLRNYGFTATVFVTTGWIADAGGHRSGHQPGQMLSWNQICEAAGAGVEIGAHSHGHPQLDQIKPSQLRARAGSQQGLAGRRDRPGRAQPGLSLRLLQRRGAAGGAGHRLPARVRGGQCDGPARWRPLRAAAPDGPRVDQPDSFRANRPGGQFNDLP